ncbi:MAG: glycosyltransferase family 2 protein [Phycisphaerae bacterium]|nr:glycosyltransferase family 2 protein [Phycisphaerae bacterium]
MQKPSISLIVSTYNQPDFLRLVLHGVANQTDTDFELLIADDGSTPETKSLIDEFKQKNSFAITHIWHDDNGFQKAQILNKAVLASKNDYVVFLDGDCVPRTHHVRDHRRLARKNRIVGCSRILLDETITKHAIGNQLQVHNWTPLKLLGFFISGHANRVAALLRVPMGPLRTITPKNWKKVRGCNFSIHKSDFIQIGGFDESFTGWGYEDSDLVARAINSECYVRRGDYLGTVFHLWHQEVNRNEAESNKSSLEETLNTGRKMARSSSIVG